MWETIQTNADGSKTNFFDKIITIFNYYLNGWSVPD